MGLSTLVPASFRIGFRVARRDVLGIRDALTAPRQPISRTPHTAAEIAAFTETARRERAERIAAAEAAGEQTDLRADFRELRVVEVVRETRRAVTLVFDNEVRDPLRFRPGQYLKLVFTIDGREVRRAYSLCSDPAERSRVAVTVKRLAGGLVSNHVNDRVRPGDRILTLGPSGLFGIEPDPKAKRRLVLVAAGSGITPIHGIARAVTARFDWTYRSDFPEMRNLYRRAKRNQWDAETALDWSIDVDPLSTDVPILPLGFIPLDKIPESITFTPKQEREFTSSILCWMLSQFLHGEQGALYAAAQVTESVPWMDGKLYGATQVMDEGRHVEVFHRYLDTKLNKRYVVNDNLFTILDSLLTDPRWDMKFLGMQIMVEGLALGAFGMLYKLTAEPLLRHLLRYVIQDEARHVHYGVLALREHFSKNLSEKERQTREDWALEIAILMRNRFMGHEVYEEYFEGVFPRRLWNEIVLGSPAMREFREVMFSRLVPNLDFIGLLTQRTRRHYEEAGLLRFAGGANATQLTADQLLSDLDTRESCVPKTSSGFRGKAKDPSRAKGGRAAPPR